MSCLLDEVSSISGLPELITWLCPHIAPVTEDLAGGSQEEPLAKLSAKWDEDFALPASEDNKNSQGEVAWLEDCSVAISPTVHLMAIACRNRLALLTSKWEKNEKGEKKAVLSVSWKSILGHTENDEITCVLCLPIVSQKQSSSGAPDWTSIVVGFKSGYISFYTENGLLLLSQIFEESSINDISCRTYFPKNFGACIYADLTEELVILYRKAIVSIEGFPLLQTLKACRNQAAKAAASGENCDNVVTLGFKKWGLTEQDFINSCVGSGMLPPHLYDHLMCMANTEGFDQSLSTIVPTTTLLLTTGRMPFYGVIAIKEGTIQPFISDIVVHFASKLKDALLSAASGWLFGNRQASQARKKQKVKIEQATPISFRYTLPDKRRIGLSIYLSPSRRLAAVTDEFGRINLIDVQKSYIIRMFKGYRDAECGWINVNGEYGEMGREVPFLVIYAPRRNLLEIWLPQQGPRVAAFNVPKESRLLYTPHTLLGAHTQQGRTFRTTPVVMLNLNGTLERISIPFHLALSGKTGKQARDIHLLKTLKAALRQQSEGQILKIVKEVQTTGVKLQLLNLITSSKYVTQSLAEELVPLLSSSKNTHSDISSEETYVDHESRLLSQQLSRLSQVLQLYSDILLLHSNSSDDKLTQQQLEAKLVKYLTLTAKDFSAYFLYLKDDKLQMSSPRKQVTFNQEVMSFSAFVNCWDITVGSVDKQAKDIIPVKLKEKITEENVKNMDNFWFGWSFNSEHTRLFLDCLLPSGVDIKQLLNLSFQFWLDHSRIDEVSTLRISFIFHTLSILSESLTQDVSEVNPFWESVRDELKSWSKPFHAYVAALVCRGIEVNILTYDPQLSAEENEISTDSTYFIEMLNNLVNKMDTTESDSNTSYDYCLDETADEWEEVSFELVEWNIILNRLRQLLSIQRLFNVITANGGKLIPDYSIKMLSDRGKGSVSELIAKWLIEANIPLERLINVVLELDKIEEGTEEGTTTTTTTTTTQSENTEKENGRETLGSPSDGGGGGGGVASSIDLIEGALKEIKKNFPQSMKSDVILLNLAWEFGAIWKKTPNSLTHFDSAIRCLGNITNPFFKHGVGCMMWETWVVHRVQTAAHLMEKFRKMPKDRIIIRETGISEFSIHDFLKSCKELLEHIMMGNVACELERPPVVTEDDFWRCITSSSALAEVAMAQKLASCDLTFLHHQLLTVLCLIVQYDLKNVRPYSLFPERDRAAFFKPLFSSWRATSEEGREIVSSLQLAFLSRVVSASVLSLPDNPSSSELSPHPSGLHDAVELGRTWGVSVDAIRRHYVCELYSSGLDAMADQALIMIRDGVVLASQMTTIAGQRLQYLITSSPKSLEVMALITPSMKEWCKKLESGCLRYPDVPVKKTLTLINRALSMLADTSADYGMLSSLRRSFSKMNDLGLFNEIVTQTN